MPFMHHIFSTDLGRGSSKEDLFQIFKDDHQKNIHICYFDKIGPVMLFEDKSYKLKVKDQNRSLHALDNGDKNFVKNGTKLFLINHWTYLKGLTPGYVVIRNQ